MLTASLSLPRSDGAFGVARLGAGLALYRGWGNIAIQGWAASWSCSPRAQASFLVTLDTDAEDTELVRRCRAGDDSLASHPCFGKSEVERKITASRKAPIHLHQVRNP